MTDNGKIYLTDEGFLEIESELNELKNIKRPAVIKALKEAWVDWFILVNNERIAIWK